MRNSWLLSLLILCVLLLLASSSVEAKKKAKKPKKSDSKLFDSRTLRCLVCQALVDEYFFAIDKIDPKKMTETGTFRISGTGDQQRGVIPYARSQEHLMDLEDKVCEAFKDYAQAKRKATNEPTIIRMTTPEGNMNPDFGNVDLVPDDDLNKGLEYHCLAIVELHGEDLQELLPDPDNDEKLKEKLCVERAKLCSKISKDEL